MDNHIAIDVAGPWEEPAFKPEREQALLWAILIRAINDCFELEMGSLDSVDLRRIYKSGHPHFLREEAEAWIFGHQADSLTSFDSLCSEFNINPRRMREAIRATQYPLCPCASCAGVF